MKRLYCRIFDILLRSCRSTRQRLDTRRSERRSPFDNVDEFTSAHYLLLQDASEECQRIWTVVTRLTVRTWSAPATSLPGIILCFDSVQIEQFSVTFFRLYYLLLMKFLNAHFFREETKELWCWGCPSS